jgi:cytochrome b subunit of formate dehydrogenase
MAKEKEQNKVQAIQWPNKKVQNKVQAIQWLKKKYKIMYRQSNGQRKSTLSAFSGVRVTRSLVLCVCFVDRCLFFVLLLLAIIVLFLLRFTDGFSLPLWYLQTLLNNMLVVSYIFLSGL